MSTYGDLELLNRPGLPVPAVSELSRPHWEGCQRGELLVQRCEDCGHYVFTPEVACTACLSDSLAWVPSSGLGVLYSFTVIHRPQLANAAPASQPKVDLARHRRPILGGATPGRDR